MTDGFGELLAVGGEKGGGGALHGLIKFPRDPYVWQEWKSKTARRRDCPLSAFFSLLAWISARTDAVVQSVVGVPVLYGSGGEW